MIRTTSAASILERLKNLRRQHYPNIPPNGMLLLYAQQGLLGRLGASPYAGHFVLKGALNLFARYGQAARPTQDLDLAAAGLPNIPERLREVLSEICQIPFADGLVFGPETIQMRPINAALQYPGVGARLRATLGPSHIDLQVDFSFGNVITPGPVHLSFPRLLIGEAVHLPAYPLETIVTEKFAALVEIGEATTRIKDLYDLYAILSLESFDAQTMRSALNSSFTARRTPLEEVPRILSETFAADPDLNARWAPYLRRSGLKAPPFPEVMALLRAFYGPLLQLDRRSGTWGAPTWRELGQGSPSDSKSTTAHRD